MATKKTSKRKPAPRARRRTPRKPLFDLVYASTSTVDPVVHKTIVDAIAQKLCLQINLRGDAGTFFGEPHVYGERGGIPALLLYDEHSDPNWALVPAADIETASVRAAKHFRKRPLPPEYDPDKQTKL